MMPRKWPDEPCQEAQPWHCTHTGIQMITFEEAMTATEAEAITGLRTDALKRDDIVNLVLQRSEVIRDQPKYNRYIRDWMGGDSTPLLELIDRMGSDVIVRRAAAFIYLEYLQLRPIFEAKAPKSIADIGCGYAMFDLFLARDYGSVVHLIDLESNDTRHFGFEEKAAAYSSLKVAKRGHCIKVTLLSGSHERTGNLCSIAKIIFPKWPEAIRAEWRVHVPQVVPGQSDMGPAKRRDVFGDIIWDGDAVVSQLGN